jgi:hypothetical protein
MKTLGEQVCVKVLQVLLAQVVVEEPDGQPSNIAL